MTARAMEIEVKGHTKRHVFVFFVERQHISMLCVSCAVQVEIQHLAQYIIWGFIRIGILLCLADTQRNCKIGFCIVICSLTT